MKIEFWHIGKTTEPYVKEGMAFYEKNIKHYCTFKTHVIPSAAGRGIKNKSDYQQYEGQKVLKSLDPADTLVVLDEAGEAMTSVNFAQWLQQRIDRSPRRIIFLIGGAYGFSKEIYHRSQYKLSLSPMTFPHQLVRILFLEQLYRAYTIIHRKSYHH